MEQINLQLLDQLVKDQIKELEDKIDAAEEKSLKENGFRSPEIFKFYKKQRLKGIAQILINNRVITEIPEHTKKCKKCHGTGRIGFEVENLTYKDADGKTKPYLNKKGKPATKHYPIICECIFKLIPEY